MLTQVQDVISQHLLETGSRVYFLDPASRVHSASFMSATHLSDNLPDVLTQFRTLLGFTASEAKLSERGYSREYELASQEVTTKDLSDKLMQAPAVMEFVREALKLLGFLMYICTCTQHQGFSNLLLTGQAPDGEIREYLASQSAHPGQLPRAPKTLVGILAKIEARDEVPRYNTNAGNARDFAALVPPMDTVLTAAQAHVRENVLGLGGDRDSSIAVVVTERHAGAGSSFSLITPR
jgi:hypothetical protein